MADLDGLVPNPLSSDREYARFYHLDIRDLDDTELTDEFHYLSSCLWGLPAEHWLRQRVSELEKELSKRRYGSGCKSSRQPKPKPAEGVKL